MANILGDYDSELFVLTLTGEKGGVEIVPQQYGPDERYNQTGRTFSSTLEGQGGAIIRSIFHPSSATFTITLMSTDPANEQLSAGCKIAERYTMDVVDNNGTAYVSGRCWVQEEPPMSRSKEATPMTWTFGQQIQEMNHGQTKIV